MPPRCASAPRRLKVSAIRAEVSEDWSATVGSRLRPLSSPRRSRETGSNMTADAAFRKLARSKFRSRFGLSDADRRYIAEKGMSTIRRHAEDFILGDWGRHPI